MIDNFSGKTAVLTGAGSGFGLECARIGARLGMNLVLVDVQQDALDAAAAEMQAAGAVGEVVGGVYDGEGHYIDTETTRLMSMLLGAVAAGLAATEGGAARDGRP